MDRRDRIFFVFLMGNSFRANGQDAINCGIMTRQDSTVEHKDSPISFDSSPPILGRQCGGCSPLPRIRSRSGALVRSSAVLPFLSPQCLLSDKVLLMTATSIMSIQLIFIYYPQFLLKSSLFYEYKLFIHPLRRCFGTAIIG